MGELCVGAAVRGRTGELTSHFWWWKGKCWRVCELDGDYGVQTEDCGELDGDLWGHWEMWQLLEGSAVFLVWRFGAGKKCGVGRRLWA